MNADNPPWDIHHQSHNPIDIAMPFRQGQTIFDFQQDEHIDKALTTHTSSDIPHLYHNDTTSHIPQNNVHYTNTQITMNPLESPTPITQQNTKSHNQDSPQYKHDTHNIVSNLQDSKLSDNTDSLSLQYQESTTLAIKYRPKTFSELIGQESVARTLSLALDSKKIANGYLFSGLRGSGKTSSARIFARCLQCETNISSTPCGICSNCKAALNGSHIDIIELDGASNRKIDDIRDVFTNTKEAKMHGYDKGRFSFNVKGGRCEACWGDGVKKIEMHFLPDVYVPCDVCGGKRYNKETLAIKFKGKNIADVLDMRVSEALPFFENIPKVYNKLKVMDEVGLSYIKLGQSAPTLSGGEAGRVKLAKELQKKPTGKSIFILDEPTTGLHSEDIKKLLTILNRIVDNGDTVIVIEHNLDVIKVADYIIDLGPEGGNLGGEIVATGTPEQVAKNPNSYTGIFLKKILEQK